MRWREKKGMMIGREKTDIYVDFDFELIDFVPQINYIISTQVTFPLDQLTTNSIRRPFKTISSIKTKFNPA